MSFELLIGTVVTGVFVPVLGWLIAQIRQYGKTINMILNILHEYKAKFDTLEKRLESLECKIDGLEKKLPELEIRIASLESKFEEVRKVIIELNGMVKQHTIQITRLETEFRNHLKYVHGMNNE